MTSGNKFWQSKKKKENSNEGIIDFDEVEIMVEDYLRRLNVLGRGEEISLLSIKSTNPGEPIAITYTKGGV